MTSPIPPPLGLWQAQKKFLFRVVPNIPGGDFVFLEEGGTFK